MSPDRDRDPVVGDALDAVDVPDHLPGFWERLDARLAAEDDRRTADDDRADGEGAGAPDGPVQPVDPPPVAPLRRPARRAPSGRTRVLLAAAIVVAIAASAGVLLDREDVRTVDTTGPASPSGTTEGPAVVDAPGGPATEAAPPGEVVLAWLDAVGAGDVEAAAARTGPRTAAYQEALGSDLREYLTVAAEGYGAWAASPDRTTTVVDLDTAGGVPTAVVVVSGTWRGEGMVEQRDDALPVVRGPDGRWLVEPVAVDPDVGGRLELSSPLPDPTGVGTLPPDGVIEAWAPGDGTFQVSLDGVPAVAVAPAVDGQIGGARLVHDPPGDLAAGEHLLVVAYLDGGATVVALATTFVVEG